MPDVAAVEPPDLAALAQAAAVRGGLLFHLFLAEALAGDAFAAALPDGVEAWAVDVGVDGYEVVALGGVGGGDVVRRVTFAADGSAQVEAPRVAASTRLRRLAAARETCAEAARAHPLRYAALVAPPPRDGREGPDLDGYLVRLPERAEDIALGPHWRLRLDGDGSRVRETALACGPDAVVAGARRQVLAVTHGGAAVPSELHVFLSLQHGVVLEVLTPDTAIRWRVDGERVTRS